MLSVLVEAAVSKEVLLTELGQPDAPTLDEIEAGVAETQDAVAVLGVEDIADAFEKAVGVELAPVAEQKRRVRLQLGRSMQQPRKLSVRHQPYRHFLRCSCQASTSPGPPHSTARRSGMVRLFVRLRPNLDRGRSEPVAALVRLDVGRKGLSGRGYEGKVSARGTAHSAKALREEIYRTVLPEAASRDWPGSLSSSTTQLERVGTKAMGRFASKVH